MIQIPKLSFDDIAKYYSLIRVSHLGVASPIECTENTVNTSWEAPTHPTEDNIFIGDTIYSEPRTVNMSVYIKSGMIQFFESQIKFANSSGIGFTIFTLGGVYNNMFVISFTRPESASVSTGYLCDITFQEVPTTSIIGNIIAIGSSAIAAAVNTINTGTVQPITDSILEMDDTVIRTGLGI